MTVTAAKVKRWIGGAVVGAVALGGSAAKLERECLDPPPPHLVPPPEAFEACTEGVEGGACEVVLPDLVVAGECVAAMGGELWGGENAEGELFCRPFIPPPPPPEAFAACEGLAFEDACGIELDCGMVRGTCDSTPMGELFCRPPFAPRP